MHDKSDFELVKEFNKGNEVAFNEIVKRYQQKIYWHARKMTGNHFDADEIVQEVLLVLYNKLKNFKFNSSLYTWIYRIVITRSINYLKKRNLRHFFSINDDENTIDVKSYENIEADIENKEKLNKLDKLLQQLPSKQREIFIMRHFDELSYEEISEITGKSIGGLKANYFHAIQKINNLMRQEDE